ncbi:hypothetical protein HDV00_005697 [Rhizophlyctis rosea]|nr:hypothetical protein HDV00_005697 [Rhizophlyctis rosea]
MNKEEKNEWIHNLKDAVRDVELGFNIPNDEDDGYGRDNRSMGSVKAVQAIQKCIRALKAK